MGLADNEERLWPFTVQDTAVITTPIFDGVVVTQLLHQETGPVSEGAPLTP